MFGWAMPEAIPTQPITPHINHMAHAEIVINFGHFRGMKSATTIFRLPSIMFWPKRIKQNCNTLVIRKARLHSLYCYPSVQNITKR